jgi:hypothetical protein
MPAAQQHSHARRSQFNRPLFKTTSYLEHAKYDAVVRHP